MTIPMTAPALLIEVSPSHDLEGGDLGNAANLEDAIGAILNIDETYLLTSLRHTIDTIGEAFKPKEGGIDESEVKFGIKVNASGNVFVAAMSADVTLEITLKWKRDAAVLLSKVQE